MTYQNMQEVADKFEAAYIQSGGLLLSVKYDPEQDAYIANPEFEGLDEEETEEVVGDVNASYEGFKLALQYQAVQSIAPTQVNIDGIQSGDKVKLDISPEYMTVFEAERLPTMDINGKPTEIVELTLSAQSGFWTYRYNMQGHLVDNNHSDPFIMNPLNIVGWSKALKTKQPTVVHLGQGHVGISQGAYEDRYALMFVTLTDPVPLGADLESNIELEADQIQVAIKVDNLESLKVLKHQLSCLEDNMKLENQVLIIDKKTGKVTKTIEPVIVPYQNHCGDKERQCTPCYTNQGECAGKPKDGGALPNNQGEYPEGTQYTKYDDNHSQNNNNTLRAYKHTGTQWEYYAPLEKQWKWSVLNLLNTPPEVYASLIPVQTGLPDPTTLAGTEPLNLSK